MLVSSIEPVYGKKHRFRVRLLDGADFILYKKELERFSITEGQDLSEDIYSDMLSDIFIPRAKSRAMHLLIKQDRSESGLRQKLRESGYPKEAVDTAIEYVMSYGYIDDIRFVQNYIISHRERQSRRRILYDLESKGIRKDVMEEAISLLEEDSDRPVFDDLSVIRKKVNSRLLQEKTDDSTRNRLYTSLQRAGFSSSDIAEAFKDPALYN